jgi:hypothetical protein
MIWTRWFIDGLDAEEWFIDGLDVEKSIFFEMTRFNILTVMAHVNLRG